MWPAIIGSLAAGGLNWLGAHQQQRFSAKSARKQMDFQRESNREQMAFQERMSSTAFQRSMDDMRKAGLNPVLAAGGGASTPSGSSSSGASSQGVNKHHAVVSSALEAAMIRAQTDKIHTENKLLKAQLPGARATAEFNAKAGVWGVVLDKTLQAVRAIK